MQMWSDSIREPWLRLRAWQPTNIGIMSDLCHILYQYYNMLPPGRRLKSQGLYFMANKADMNSMSMIDQFYPHVDITIKSITKL